MRLITNNMAYKNLKLIFNNVAEEEVKLAMNEVTSWADRCRKIHIIYMII